MICSFPFVSISLIVSIKKSEYGSISPKKMTSAIFKKIDGFIVGKIPPTPINGSFLFLLFLSGLMPL
jgi:hypothetical protein